MTGLRARERDRGLIPKDAAQGLLPPSEDEISQLVAGGFHRASERPDGVSWDYARWKPGVSMTCSYTVRFADGTERCIALKRYVDGKERTVADKWRVAAGIEELCEPLLPRKLVAEKGMVMWTFPADRMLSAGLARLLDPRLLNRTLVEDGFCDAGQIRRRKTASELLRYKPERRAVLRIDLRLRDTEPKRRTLAARVHPDAEAAEIAAQRRRFELAGGAELAPGVGALEKKSLYVIEEWLDIEPSAPDSFAHAYEAGELLARLHSLPAPEEQAAEHPAPAADYRSLFAIDPRLKAPPAAAAFRAPPTWVHGDFHPDQVCRRSDATGWVLMDLDALGSGDPHSDLASWIADALVEGTADDARTAAAPLLEGYEAGGARLDGARLSACVSDELVARAAGSIRRLEKGALGKAQRALELAHASRGKAQRA